MLLLRILVPPEQAATVLAYLEGLEIATDLLYLAGAARKPAGDVVQCTVPREAASAVVGALKELGIDRHGSISLDNLDATVSQAADEAEEEAAGTTADAVVWEEVERRADAMATLSGAFVVYMAAATVIASVSILTDSLVLLIGAMVVGPEFGPIAGLCVGLTQRRRELVRRGAVTLVVGFTFAIAAAFVATWCFVAAGVAPNTLDAAMHPATLFISRPDAYSVVVAALARVVGTLSLTTASMGTLIGVLISVTTLPAAANLGVAAAFQDGGEARGAAIQLGLNLGVLVLAGLATLRIQRLAFTRQLTGFLAGARRARVRRPRA